MPENLLLLYPADPMAAPAVEPLVSALQEIGLLGDPFTCDGAPHFRPGEAFLRRITYLGCSPVVALGEPGATGDEFAHLALSGPYETPRFLAGTNVKQPRCPACRQRAEPWQDWPQRLAAGEAWRWQCPACGTANEAVELDWRQCAGHARLFLTVWGVFEGEAVPSDDLLKTLAGFAGPWRWSYVRR